MPAAHSAADADEHVVSGPICTLLLDQPWGSGHGRDQREVAAFACAARGAHRTKMPVP
jgi:hypothetical protein